MSNCPSLNRRLVSWCTSVHCCIVAVQAKYKISAREATTVTSHELQQQSMSMYMKFLAETVVVNSNSRQEKFQVDWYLRW